MELMCKKFMGEGAELIVPLLTKSADERLAKELVEGQVQLSAFVAATTADLPAVVVQADGTIAEPLFTNRVESAADWFHEVCLSGATGTFEGTKAILHGTGCKGRGM